MTYHEPKDPRTGKAPEHVRNAKKGKSPAGKNPKIDFKESMYIGYNDSGEFMEIEMTVNNTGKSNKISMSGTEGEIMKESDIDERVEDYWNNINLEDEYGYMADETIGTDPDEDDIEAELPYDTPPSDEDEDAYNEAYDIAYEDAVKKLAEKRKEYLESIESELKSDGYFPYEYHDKAYADGEHYIMTLHSCGQVLDSADQYTSVIPAKDLEFIVESWEKHHLFEVFGNDKESGRSMPPVKTMQRLVKIYENYQTRGGDEFHVGKIVKGLGI